MGNNYRCQNDEIDIVLHYFAGKTGKLLDIGANDGITLSNSYDLIEQGWGAVLLEPGSVYDDARLLHAGNPNVTVLNFGIGVNTGSSVFYESGAHVPNGKDRALVSSIYKEETERWRRADVQFVEKEIELKSWQDSGFENEKFDFISIDAEGCDWDILQQINLTEVGCKCLCIEWNSNRKIQILFTDYCWKYGMREIHRNAENIIYAL